MLYSPLSRRAPGARGICCLRNCARLQSGGRVETTCSAEAGLCKGCGKERLSSWGAMSLSSSRYRGTWVWPLFLATLTLCKAPESRVRLPGIWGYPVVHGALRLLFQTRYTFQLIIWAVLIRLIHELPFFTSTVHLHFWGAIEVL